nr:PepSY-associated TM helix domain-containing protein [Sphingomonas tagetis]
MLGIHRWAGILLGSHWLLLAASGCFLVVHREVEIAAVGAGAAVAPEAGVERAIAAVRLTGATPTRVMVQGDPARAYRVFADRDGDPAIVMVDAASGAVLDTTPAGGGTSRSGWVRAIYKFHQQLLLGGAGESLVGISGLFLLVTVVLGVKIGWPARRQWRATLWPRLANNPRFKLQQLHRSVGLWIAAPLMLSAVTGMATIWSSGLRAILPVATSPAAADLPGTPAISPSAAIQAARAALPQGKFSRIDLPPTGERGYVVHLRQPGEARAFLGNSRTLIDGGSGAVVQLRDTAALPWGDRVIDSLVPIHNGEWLGWAGRMVTMLTGLSLLGLAGSGVAVWALSARRKRGSQAKAVTVDFAAAESKS